MKLIILSILLSCTFYLNAQEKKLIFQPGVSAVAGITLNNDSELGGGGGYGAGLHLRYVLTGSENFSITAGTHAILGAEGGSDTRGDSYLFVIVDVPLVIDFNLGNGATNESTNRFGVYMGGGYDFITYATFDTKFALAHGPILDAGLKWRLFGRNSGMHFTTMIPVNVKAGLFVGFGVLTSIKKSESSGGYKSEGRSGGWEWIR